MSSSFTPRLVALVTAVVTLAPLIVVTPGSETPLVPGLPADSLAVAFISRPQSDVSLLAALQLDEVVGLDDSRMAAVPASLVAEIGSLFQDHSARLWVAILEVEHRVSTDSWKPHFCILLEPRQGQTDALVEAVDRTAAALVGPQLRIHDSPSLRTFQGTPEARVLYRARPAQGVLVSNSAAVLQRTLSSLAGRQPGLSGDVYFSALSERLLRPTGIFLYVNGSRLLPFLPHMGYHIEQGWFAPREEWLTIPSTLETPQS